MLEPPSWEELREEFAAAARIQAWLEGWAQGRTEGRMGDILHILEDRFGAVPAEVRDAVQATRDEERLDTLLLAAVHCPDVEALRVRLTS